MMGKGQAENQGITIKPKLNNTGKPVKMISGDLLPAFRSAVEGSALTKTGLIEVLKKQFPKCSKDAIKDTLSHIAMRQGAKEIEKRWVLV
jgi:chromatin assembly factor 1 subunit A